MKISEDGTETKREFYKSYLILVRSLYNQSQPDSIKLRIGDVKRRFLVGSVMFLAFAMESFINDFGDRYIDDFEDLERIESLNKFLMFPRIARTNASALIKKSEVHYSALKELFRYRDYFVHYKPAFRSPSTKEEKLFMELNHKKVSALYKRMIQLLKLINLQFSMFEEADDWISDYSEDIKAGV